MNLFILSADTQQIALWMMDKHIVKIILEAVQMLCSAYRLVLPDGDHSKLYKLTHANHPVSKWVRASYANFVWTLDLCDAMHEEWRYRYGHPETRVHKSYLIVLWMRENMPTPDDFSEQNKTPFALAMPDVYKCDCPYESYRRYYQSDDKRKIATWKNRNKPEWYS